MNTRIATATYKDYPREYVVKLIQTGPKTFVWMGGTNRVYGVPNFRTAEAAKSFATANGWIIWIS